MTDDPKTAAVGMALRVVTDNHQPARSAIADLQAKLARAGDRIADLEHRNTALQRALVRRRAQVAHLSDLLGYTVDRDCRAALQADRQEQAIEWTQ